MTRRDTIIIAVLINAGLMALLFMLAINHEEGLISETPKVKEIVVESTLSNREEPIPTSSNLVLSELHHADEMDLLLKDIVSHDFSQLSEEESLIDFDKEVKAGKVGKNEINDKLIVSKAEDPSKFVEVTVKRGDALEKIARSNGTTVTSIKNANGLSSSKLTIGQVLKVPVGKKEITETKPSKSPTISSTPPVKEQRDPGFEYYTLKSGDNPWKIAKQFQVRFDDLLKMNNLDEEKARNLKIGDKIRVR